MQQHFEASSASSWTCATLKRKSRRHGHSGRSCDDWTAAAAAGCGARPKGMQGMQGTTNSWGRTDSLDPRGLQVVSTLPVHYQFLPVRFSVLLIEFTGSWLLIYLHTYRHRCSEWFHQHYQPQINKLTQKMLPSESSRSISRSTANWLMEGIAP